uniref:Uncharacterized protein n=1 Tax=mine drainage metagenome TaxID=410659 RepID=E6PMU9_9ZZZZ
MPAKPVVAMIQRLIRISFLQIRIILIDSWWTGKRAYVSMRNAALPAPMDLHASRWCAQRARRLYA